MHNCPFKVNSVACSILHAFNAIRLVRIERQDIRLRSSRDDQFLLLLPDTKRFYVSVFVLFEVSLGLLRENIIHYDIKIRRVLEDTSVRPFGLVPVENP